MCHLSPMCSMSFLLKVSCYCSISYASVRACILVILFNSLLFKHKILCIDGLLKRERLKAVWKFLKVHLVRLQFLFIITLFLFPNNVLQSTPLHTSVRVQNQKKSLTSSRKCITYITWKSVPIMSGAEWDSIRISSWGTLSNDRLKGVIFESKNLSIQG